jgi:hypothetical protein
VFNPVRSLIENAAPFLAATEEHKLMKRSWILSVAAVLAGMSLMSQALPKAWAQDDPPGRAARLDYTVGSVSFQPGGEGDWVQAVVNRPLSIGDNLWADKDSRAEVQVGSTSIRIDSETSVTVLNMDDHTTQLRLSQGSMIVRVRHLDDDDNFEIDTPNSAFTVQRTGEYRVDVNADGTETDTTVWQGRAEVSGGGASYTVVAGQLARFTGTDQLNHDIEQVPGNDDFDNFAFDRDQNEDQAEASNYVSPEMTGAEDLGEYGHWTYVADYGPVWAPNNVAPGWAPYRFGHWVWVAPWGWTWVEDEPWGFAPFHYGRWAYVGAGWCWVPGPVVVRPVYAPALVAFVGGGFVGGVGVAWFPLAPREVFVPWYHTSPGYINNVNITNTRVNVTQITNVTNVYNTTTINNTNVTHITYANQHVAGGVTAVSHDTFVNARPVAQNIAKVDPRQLESAPVTREMTAQPARQSVVGAGRPAAVRPPAAVLNRQVVATRTPPAPRSPFEQRQPATNVRTETPGEAQPAHAANQPPARPASEPARPEPPPINRPAPPQQQAARPAAPQPHPLVRPAPPVQERPEQQQNEAQKFNAWQQQRQQAAPRPSAPPRPAAPHPAAPKPPQEHPH